MENEDLIAQYDQILGGKFIPFQASVEERRKETRAPEVNDSNQSNRSQPAPAGSQPGPKREWIPELKKVVQFSDPEGKKHVIGLESYKSRARSSRRAQSEELPFKDFAILLKAIINNDGEAGIKADFRLELQSEGLRDIFRRIARSYRELSLDSDPIVIEYPFRCLFFLRGKLRELSQADGTPPATQKELSQLLDFINAPVGHQKIIAVYNELVPYGKITFPMLWTLFPPYEPVMYLYPGEDAKHEPCYMLESVKFKEDKSAPAWEFQLLCGYHDGTKYYLKRVQQSVNWFDGIKDISQRHLPLIPLQLFEENKRNEIRASLIQRGKLYVHYCKKDFSFMHYKGTVTLRGNDDEKRLSAWGSKGSLRVGKSISCFLTLLPTTKKMLQIDERVIIDRTAERMVGNIDDNIGETVSSCLSDYLSTSDTRQGTEAAKLPLEDPGSLHDLLQSDLATSNSSDQHVGDWMLDPQSYSKPAVPELTDDDYLICRSNIVGFALDQKLWVWHIRISLLREIEWKADPFQSLQLLEDKKLLVHRLVKGFDNSKADTYDDLIEGKGRGLIFLLHGAPGLGKTLTAGMSSRIPNKSQLVKAVNQSVPCSARVQCGDMSACQHFNFPAKHLLLWTILNANT
jgi:hypothetical protein